MAMNRKEKQELERLRLENERMRAQLEALESADAMTVWIPAIGSAEYGLPERPVRFYLNAERSVWMQVEKTMNGELQIWSGNCLMLRIGGASNTIQVGLVPRKLRGGE